MSDLTDIIDALIEKHDALREVYFPDTRFYLLNLDGENTPYTVVVEITTGSYLKYSEFKGFFKLRHATQNLDFKLTLDLSSHVLVGNDVYIIDESESLPPIGSKPFWTLACKRTGEKFTQA